eukprot:jgi/Tetstr1/455669/TSEL_042480.t1
MSTSINTGMMNTSLANLARQSAIKTDPGDAPPPPHFRDDTRSFDDAFIMDEASDSDSGDIQHIKPAAVKPTLNLKNVPIWDNTISTRDNAQAIKIALGSAAYLDTTKGKGTRQEQMMLMAALRHATAHYPMALSIVNNISMDSNNGLPVMLTCTTTAPGGAATGAQEGEGEEEDDDEFHESWHVPYSNSDDNFHGCRIYNPAAGRKTPPLSMPAFQFSNAAYLMDAFQPSGQKEAQLTSHYVDLSDYHPTLVASAIAAVVRPRSARLTALALLSPTVRVSTAPRIYHEDISSTRPDDWTKSMNHEINSITTMALFVWVNVPELRRDNESQVIQQTAWAFAAQHEDGDIKREAGVIVRGNLLTTGQTYAYDYLPLGCGRKVRAWHPVEALYNLPQESKAWFLSFSFFLHDFSFIGSEPGGVIHLHRETCIIDILTTFHMTESKPRRRLCSLNTNFHNTAITYRQEGVRVAHAAINALRNAANTVKYRLAEARRADKTPPVELFDINNKLLASDDNSLIDVNEYMVGLNARKRAKLMGKLRDGL